MPIVKNLAGLMAKEFFGRPESAGHEIVREGQACGIFEKGKGGGFGGSPQATSRDGVLVYLALLHRGLEPQYAIADAQIGFNLKHAYSIARMGKPKHPGDLIAGVTAETGRETLPTLYRTFGVHLSWLVHSLRSRRVASDTRFFETISIGVNKGWFIGEMTTPEVAFLPDGTMSVRRDMYGALLKDIISDTPHERYKQAPMSKHMVGVVYNFLGTAIQNIAWALGHLGEGERDDIGDPDAMAFLRDFAAQMDAAKSTEAY